jgi:hypothetical protein
MGMPESRLKRIGDLDIAEDIDFERRSWTIQRVAWIVMALILLAALLGLFGNGWLSHAQTSDSGGALRIEYDRFVRHQARGELRVHFNPAAAAGGDIGLWIDQQYLDSIEMTQITPEPRDQIAVSDGVIYIFEAKADGESVEVLFQFEVQSMGTLRGRFAVANSKNTIGEQLSINQWSYP